MFYVKFLLVIFWLVICCVFGLFYIIPRWGNTNINRDFGRAFGWGTLKILGIKVEFEGLEHLDTHQPCIYIGNHQSALDMAIFGLIYPKNTLVIGKRELLWIPFFGIFFLAAGNIIINRKKSVKAVAELKQTVEAIVRRKVSIWVFPEGTRNKKGDGLLPFKRGAFHMALQAGIPLVPIVASSLIDVANWKKKKVKRGVVRVKILPPISVDGYRETEIEKLLLLAHTKMTEAFHSLSSS